MFRASAQSYSDEISSGLYNEHQILQMSAQAVTWTEAADSLENMYLIDDMGNAGHNFEKDLDDVISTHKHKLGLCPTVGHDLRPLEVVGILEATKHRILSHH